MQLTHVPNWRTTINSYRNTVNALYVKHAEISEIFTRLAPHAWKGYPKIRGEITIPHASPTLITGENARIVITSIVPHSWKKLAKNSAPFNYHISKARATKSCETGCIANHCHRHFVVQDHCPVEIVHTD